VDSDIQCLCADGSNITVTCSWHWRLE